MKLEPDASSLPVQLNHDPARLLSYYLHRLNRSR